MKNSARIAILLILFICCLNVSFSSASHLLGADISYRHIGADHYEVTVKAYRDCNGVSLSNSPLLVVPQNCTGSSFVGSFSLVSVTEITPLCPGLSSTCSGGTYQYGIEEHLFRDTIDLSGFTNCCRFKLSWEQSARSSAITTGAASQNFYVEAILDKCNQNSSAAFTVRPQLTGCAGQDFCYNPGAIDSTDKDSLVISLVPALMASGTPVSYGTNFSYDKPLMFLGYPNTQAPLPAGIHLDSGSGDFCFRPTMVQVGVVAIKVTEWRNISGVPTIVGEVTRDMQMNIISCQNNYLPKITGPVEYEVCPGNTLCIGIPTTDQDAGDTVRLSWNSGIPSASFNANFPSGSKRQTATFCWTPDHSDALSTPHYFSVTATDNACPANGSTTKNFSVLVRPADANLKVTTTITPQSCGDVSFQATPLISGTYTYQWNLSINNKVFASRYQQSFTENISEGGTIVAELYVTPQFAICPTRFLDTVDLDSFLTVTLPPDTEVCPITTMQIGSTVTNGNGPLRYKWNTGVNDTFPQVTVTTGQLIETYYLTVTDAACTATDTIHVRSSLYNVSAGPDQEVCVNAAPMLLQSGQPGGGTWTGTGMNPVYFDPLMAGVGVHKLFYTYTNGLCSHTDSIEITVTDSIRPGFTTSLTSGNKPLAVNFNDTTIGGYYRLWNFGDVGSGTNFSTLENPSHTYLNPGFYTVSLTLTDTATSGCSGSITKSNHILVFGSVGIGKMVAPGEINIFPNPASASFEIVVDAHLGVNYSMQIFDISGRILREQIIRSANTIIDCEGLNSGLYFVRLNAADGTVLHAKVMIE